MTPDWLSRTNVAELLSADKKLINDKLKIDKSANAETAALNWLENADSYGDISDIELGSALAKMMAAKPPDLSSRFFESWLRPKDAAELGLILDAKTKSVGELVYHGAWGISDPSLCKRAAVTFLSERKASKSGFKSPGLSKACSEPSKMDGTNYFLSDDEVIRKVTGEAKLADTMSTRKMALVSEAKMKETLIDRHAFAPQFNCAQVLSEYYWNITITNSIARTLKRINGEIVPESPASTSASISALRGKVINVKKHLPTLQDDFLNLTLPRRYLRPSSTNSETLSFVLHGSLRLSFSEVTQFFNTYQFKLFKNLYSSDALIGALMGQSAVKNSLNCSEKFLNYCSSNASILLWALLLKTRGDGPKYLFYNPYEFFKKFDGLISVEEAHVTFFRGQYYVQVADKTYILANASQLIYVHELLCK